MRAYFLEIARDLIVDFPAASVDEIAATAGVTAEDLFTHFRSLAELKDAIENELVAERQLAGADR